MKITISAIALLSLAAVGASAQDHAQTSRAFDMRGFDRIEMSGCDIATVKLGPVFGVTALGRADNIDNLRIDTSGGALRIRRKDNSCNGHDRRVAIEITLPSLKAIDTSGAAELTLPMLDVPGFDARTSGASVLRVSGLRGGWARFGSSGASQVTVQDLQAGRVVLDLSGASVQRVEGAARRLTVDASGTANADMRRLSAPDAKFSASGMANIRAAATQAAQVDASGMANVAVATPAHCTVSKSGLARVTCG